MPCTASPSHRYFSKGLSKSDRTGNCFLAVHSSVKAIDSGNKATANIKTDRSCNIRSFLPEIVLLVGAQKKRARQEPIKFLTMSPGSGVRLNPFSRKHDLDEAFTVLYAGNIGLTQDFEMLLDHLIQIRIVGR